MTTLAQLMIENGGVYGHTYDVGMKSWKESVLKMVRDRLLLASDLETLIDSEEEREFLLPRIPERFVFDCDVISIVDNLVLSKSIDSKILPETATMPCPTIWVEWPSMTSDGHKCKIGFLASSNMKAGSDDISVIFCGAIDDIARAFGVMSFPTLPMAFYDKFTVHWWMDRDVENATQEQTYDMGGYAWDVFKCMFALMTPRVSEVREVEYSHKLQRKRSKSGKLPLIEHKRVYMKIGVAAPSYRRADGSSPGQPGEEGHHRRLHHVVNHFRVYRKDREVPRVALVPGHWRGNAELGIILKERHVKE